MKDERNEIDAFLLGILIKWLNCVLENNCVRIEEVLLLTNGSLG